MARGIGLYAGAPIKEHATVEDVERHFRAVANGEYAGETFTVVSDDRTLLVAMVFPRGETEQYWIVWLVTGEILQYLAAREVVSEDFVDVMQFGAPHRLHRNCLLPAGMVKEAIAGFCDGRALREGVWVDRVSAQPVG